MKRKSNKKSHLVLSSEEVMRRDLLRLAAKFDAHKVRVSK